MKHLTRKTFLDLAWTPADLDSAAEFWLRLYEEAAREQSFTAEPDHVTELRLRGFPRAEGPLLADELARRAASSEFRRPVVELIDPDTIVLVSEPTAGGDAPPAGLGLPLLEGPGFDDLVVEIRFTATGGQGRINQARLSFTLVMVGRVVGGVFVLKAVWRTGSSAWEDDLCWSAPWPQVDDWLKALAGFRETNAVPVKLAKAVCVPRGADRFTRLVVKLLHVPLGKPRLAGLLGRCLVFGLALGGLGLIGYVLAQTEKWFWLLLLAVGLWWVPLLFVTFARNEARLWLVGFRLFHAIYAKLYEEAHRLGPPSPAAAKMVADDPRVRKYTADLEAAGFVRAGDLMTDPPLGGEGAFRVFRAPDGVTHLTLVCTFTTANDAEQAFHNWPCEVSFLAHTIFADGGYAASVSGRGNGYRRKRTGPEVLVRVFPDETDPQEFVRLHAKAAAEFAEETGRRARPQESFAEFARRQDAILEDERRFFHGNPYTWGDHLRWYLQRPRNVFLG
jgi:hypothetical protein